MIDLIRGLHTPPWIVGMVRGAVEAALIAAVIVVTRAVSDQLPAESLYAALIPLVTGIVKGYLDQIDPEKKRN